MSKPLDQMVSGPEHRHIRLQWHMVSEYPPQAGGVSDYSYCVASGLAAAGDEVHVWAPASSGEPPVAEGVVLHRDLGRISPRNLRAVGRKLDRYAAPRRILVQWVPHAYGYRSMNLPLCWWLWKRARLHGDHLEIMVHEPFLPFRMGLWRQNAAALIHRFMTILLLQAAARVWVATPAWEQRWRPYLLGRRIPFAWLPIPSNVLPDENDSATQIVRQRYAPHEKILIGHFGTHGPAVTTLLEPILLGLKERATAQTVLLIGIGSQEFEEKLLRRRPELRDLVQATGPLSSQDLSRHLAACDVLIQPYPGGLSCRNSSLMAGLSHGKPIVTTRGILSEPFWQESHAVALVEEGQTSAFLDRVQQLHDNPGERARLGREAQNFYRDRFDVSNTVRSLRNACAGPTLERRISRLAPHLYSLYLAVVIILFIAIRVLSSGTWRMLRHP